MMENKRNVIQRRSNLSILSYNVCPPVITVYSYATTIIKIENKKLYLNTEYFSYSASTRRHYTWAVGMLDVTREIKDILHNTIWEIKEFQKCNQPYDYDISNYENNMIKRNGVKKFILESLGLDFETRNTDLYCIIAL